MANGIENKDKGVLVTNCDRLLDTWHIVDSSIEKIWVICE